MRAIFPEVQIRLLLKGRNKNSGRFLIFFSICFFFLSQFISAPVFSQSINFSYSYFNITRNNGGGTLEPGDIIEVHALGFVEKGATIERMRFIDSIRSGTQYIPNSLRIISNEATSLLTYTDASNDDAGVYDASVPGVRINIGTSSAPDNAQSGSNFYSTSGGGTVKGGDIPVAGGGTLGIVAYRLRITANFGDTIRLGGNFYYRENSKNRSHHFEGTAIKVVKNQGFCPNFSSASFTAESSFGSGSTQNRSQSVSAPGYTKVNITSNKPNDNYYAIVNNTSGDGTTDNSGSYKPNSHRVFGAWDIIGDHTNASNPATGNPPVSPGTTGGYMLLVNADYNTGLTYQDMITNLCPNTYYEFSAWIRNLCGQCGADLGGNAKGPGYHGVMPNLTYTINGVDYYTTGDIAYTGTWVKRGFIYKTGPAETSFVLGIKNNSSGGDGNDWALDDINFSTCYPNLIMNPNDTATACAGYAVTITDTVKSYYNNYGNYQWEASEDGNTWFPVKITGGSIVPGTDPQTVTPILVNGLYEYHVDAMVIPRASDSGYYFRLKVATSIGNLNDINCSVDKSQKVFLKVYGSSCKTLDTKIESFTGSVVYGNNALQWTIGGDEKAIGEFIVEKSNDGVNFINTGTVLSEVKKGSSYNFTDPENNSATSYYRLKMTFNGNIPAVYSKAVLLYNRNSAAFKISTVNPFRDNLKVDVSVPAQGKLELNLYDMYGKSLRKKSIIMTRGNSQVIMDDVSMLPPGMYLLTAFYNGMAIQNKLIKNN